MKAVVTDMHPRKEQNFVDRLASMAVDRSGVNTEFASSPEYADYLALAATTSARTGRALDGLTDHLLKEPDFKRKFSRVALRRSLELTLYLISPDDTIDAVRETLRDALRQLENYDVEQRVVFGIDGITMRIDSVEIADFTIYLMTDERADALTQEMRQVVDDPGYPLPHARDSYRAYYAGVIGSLRGKVCAEFHAVLDQAKAMEVAEPRLRNVFELLRYALYFVGTSLPGLRIGILGEHLVSTRYYFLLPTNYVGTADHMEQRDVIATLDMDEDAVAQMTKAGIFEMGDVLREGVPTEFDEMLLRVIHWCADARCQWDDDNEFLSLMIALETLFTPEKDAPYRENDKITRAIAEGVTVTMSPDIGERRYWRNAAEALYDCRSRLSHGGKRGVPAVYMTLAYRIIEGIVPELIRRRSEFGTREQFLLWVNGERDKLGSRGGSRTPAVPWSKRSRRAD